VLIVCLLRAAIAGDTTEHLEEKCWAGDRSDMRGGTAWCGSGGVR